MRVYEGSATLTDGSGKNMQLRANQEATVNRRGDATIKEVAGSALVVNRSVRRVLVLGSLPAVTFNWPALGGAGPHTFELAKDESFSAPMVVTQVPGRRYTTTDISPFGRSKQSTVASSSRNQVPARRSRRALTSSRGRGWPE